MATDLKRRTGRWRRPYLAQCFALVSGLLLALGAGWGAVSAAQVGTATPAVTPAPDAPRLEIPIEQLNDSGVTGTATLYEAGADRTIVEIAVKNVSGNHPAHIHQGTCDQIAPEPAYDLENIDEHGKSTTLIDVSLADLLAKPYVIDAHLSPNELGTLIMCGEITGTPTSPNATPAATTAPTATPTAPATEAAQNVTGVGGETGPLPTTPAVTPTPTEAPVTPVPTKAPVTPAPTKAPVTPSPTPFAVVSGKGIPAAGIGMGGDGTGGSTANSVATTGGAAEVLRGVDGSGVSGTATLFPADDGASAVIQVSLRGDLVGPDNLVHLHIGTCDNLDPDYTVVLNSLNANGVSETVVNIPYGELLTDGYAINVHASADDYDTWLVCGELSASAGAMTETGVGGQTANLLPRNTGAGTSLPRPETTAMAIAWSLGFLAVLTGGCALLIRRRESRRSRSRWLRLGL